jgi:hypothetical protein
MGLLFLVLIILIFIGLAVAMPLHKSLVKHEVRLPYLWSILAFIAVCALACLALYYTFAVNFRR